MLKVKEYKKATWPRSKVKVKRTVATTDAKQFNDVVVADMLEKIEFWQEITVLGHRRALWTHRQTDRQTDIYTHIQVYTDWPQVPYAGRSMPSYSTAFQPINDLDLVPGIITVSRCPANSWPLDDAIVTDKTTLPSQLRSVDAFWPVPNYTAWWQRHMCVNNLPMVVTWKWSGGRESNEWRQRAKHWLMAYCISCK